MSATLPRLTGALIMLGLALIIGGGLLSYEHTFADCVYPGVRVLTWVDANTNGIRETEEVVSGKVRVSMPTTTAHDLGGVTDQRGLFVLPGSCTCYSVPAWTHLSVTPPAGYRATTRTSVTGATTDDQFGFQALATAPWHGISISRDGSRQLPIHPPGVYTCWQSALQGLGSVRSALSVREWRNGSAAHFGCAGWGSTPCSRVKFRRRQPASP